jgi:hypothetical protein
VRQSARRPRLQLTLDITHEIKLALAGHESWQRRFKAQPGKGIEVNLVPNWH